jgi:hypothetical protein
LTKHPIHGHKTPLLLAASVLLGGLWLAGCDERVTIVHNQDVPVLKHQTRHLPGKKQEKQRMSGQ